MTDRVLRVRDATDELRRGIATIQEQQKLPTAFPPEVETAAEKAAATPRLPDLDRTDLPLVTLDPKGSKDLDQALHLERDGDGYVVHYAIADVAAFVEPGDPVDLEAHRRGETLYGADTKVPLHPLVLSEGAASLLPDEVRPALLWTVSLDAAGAITEATVERARVRSTARLAYDDAPDHLGEQGALLEQVGTLRLQQEAARGGVSLPMPEQEVVVEGDRWGLELRRMRPVETWNAQLSLLTGIAAATMMLEAKVGILRTLPPAEDRAVRRLRRAAKALGVAWPDDQDYPAFVRSLDPSKPADAAMVVACTSLLRGAGYTPFDGAVPEQTQHAALATPYAHVTAPLRRLVDRYGLEVCVSLATGTPVPQWVRDALPGLPGTMRDSGRRAGAYEHAVTDLVEAFVLRDRVGETFPGVVLDADHDDPTRGHVQVAEPAVEARVVSDRPLPVGEETTVTLAVADPGARQVEFRL